MTVYLNSEGSSSAFSSPVGVQTKRIQVAAAAGVEFYPSALEYTTAEDLSGSVILPVEHFP